MTTQWQQIAQDQAYGLSGQIAALRGERPILGGVCRADGWTIEIHPVSGDFDVDDDVVDNLLSELAGHSRDAVFGAGSAGANAINAARASTQAAMERSARAALERGRQSILSGARRSVRINQHMHLYNANSGKGMPRVRLRITNLPVSVASPIAPAGAWRTNPRGTTHSIAWRDPGSRDVARAAAVSSDIRWNSRMGWATGRVSTGVITFAPTAAIDVWNNLEFDMDAHGRRRFERFDARGFAIDSARSQSGNVVGALAGAGAVKAVAVVTAGAVVGAPLILIGLAVGIIAVVAWNASGMSERSGRLAERVLGP